MFFYRDVINWRSKNRSRFCTVQNREHKTLVGHRYYADPCLLCIRSAISACNKSCCAQNLHVKSLAVHQICMQQGLFCMHKISMQVGFLCIKTPCNKSCCASNLRATSLVVHQICTQQVLVVHQICMQQTSLFVHKICMQKLLWHIKTECNKYCCASNLHAKILVTQKVLLCIKYICRKPCCSPNSCATNIKFLCAP